MAKPGLAETTLLKVGTPPAPVGSAVEGLSREGPPASRISLREETEPEPVEAFVALQHSRVRVAALILAGLTSLLGTMFLAAGNPVWRFHVSASISIWATFGWLSSTRASRDALRVAEYLVFGAMTADLVAGEYLLLLRTATGGDPLAFANVVDTTFAGSILLMFAYGMLIPNTWRAAIGPVCLILLTPASVVFVLYILHPEVHAFASERNVPVFRSRVLYLDVAAAALAVYGAHVLGTLRHEVFESRRLNQYHLRERLGGGGMGEVHLAEHRLLRRLCAVKLIRSQASSDRDSLARFEREVRATAKLSHPNIIEIYDYGLADDGTFYYVMEYLRGLSVADLVGEYGPLPPGRVISLLRQACEGLVEAHAAGLVHRDITSGNVFVARVGTRSDVVKLLDFGLVAGPAAGPNPDEGLISGTPQFMAPEQTLADPRLDARSDIYSLGAVAYFMLTGRPPFEAENAYRTMLAHRHDAVEPPSNHRPGLPADLEAVVVRCLSKKPANRFGDATSLGSALAACRSAGDWGTVDASEWWRQFRSRQSR